MEGRTLMKAPGAPEAFWYRNERVDDLKAQGFKEVKAPTGKKDSGKKPTIINHETSK